MKWQSIGPLSLISCADNYNEFLSAPQTVDTWQSSLVPTGATHQEEDEDFGDFCHVTVVAPPVEKQLGGLFGGSVTPNTSGGFSTQPSNDSVSLGA